nr:hypothetical protein [uncultured Emticicia sp.]
MQTTIPSQQNHFQNLLTLAIFLLIICYYAFNGIPKSETLLIEDSPEQSKSVVLETKISKLRAAVLMNADVVEINGSLYATENALEDMIGVKKTKTAILKIHEKLILGDRKNALLLINQLPTLLLLK